MYLINLIVLCRMKYNKIASINLLSIKQKYKNTFKIEITYLNTIQNILVITQNVFTTYFNSFIGKLVGENITQYAS